MDGLGHAPERHALPAWPRYWILIVLTCHLLSGCVVGPDFQRPLPPTLARHFQAAGSEELAPPNPCECWWDSFHDPILSSLITDARQANLDLRQAYLRVREARARLGVVRGDWFPQMSGTSSYSYRDISGKSSQFGNSLQSTPPFDFYSMGFDTSWEIDLFGKIARTVESARADADAEAEFAKYFQVSLVADLAATYVQLRVAETRLNVVQQNLMLQGQTLEKVQHRHAAGLLNPLDEALADAHVRRTASRLPELEQDIQRNRNRLAVLTGVAPSEEFDLRLGSIELPQFEQTMMVGVPADLVRRRPDVRQAELQVASANALVGVAIADRLPQITIRGSIDVEARSVSDLFTSAALAHAVGPSFRWNVLNFGKLRNNVEVRRIQFEGSLARYQQSVLRSIEEVENSLVGYHRQTERSQAMTAVVQATQEAAKLSQTRWEEGLVDFITVVVTQRELLNVEEELVLSNGQVLLNVIQTYKALGGGWDCPLYRIPTVESTIEPTPTDSQIGADDDRQLPPEPLEVPPSER
ncbi:MAG: efflux transporter outer membrane subunit [Planctomycetota bacterium]|nr:efflux transporter outer membrane subunit [Planctomycetota bacterium]MDA1180370.1 efflux transporter outer membrane subunit [Planctomycetota bacterium]